MLETNLRNNLQNFLSLVVAGNKPVIFLNNSQKELFKNESLKVEAQWKEKHEMFIQCDNSSLLGGTKNLYVTTMQHKQLFPMNSYGIERDILIGKKEDAVTAPVSLLSVMNCKHSKNIPINDWIPANIYVALGGKSLTTEKAKTLLAVLKERPVEIKALGEFKAWVKKLPYCFFSEMEDIISLMLNYQDDKGIENV